MSQILLYVSITTLVFIPVKCSFTQRIQLEEKYIDLIYDHQLQGVNSTNGFQQTIDISPFSSSNSTTCSYSPDSYCLNWENIAQFKIVRKNKNCEDYELTTTFPTRLKVTFDISAVHLFGGPEHDYQAWPSDLLELKENSFVSKDEGCQAVLEPYWLASNGMYLYVHEETPLFITQNKRKKIFELIAKNEAPYVKQSNGTNLKYTVCKFPSMRDAHEHAVTNIFKKPTGIPDKLMIQQPVWSTWARYKTEVSQDIVAEFANKITAHKLPGSQIEIDDRWEMCYGSLVVDKDIFPNMKELVEELHQKGFRVTIWVHPFVNVDCLPWHREGKNKGYFVKSQNGSITTSWWHGDASYIDFTNPEAAQWFKKRLEKLLNDTGIDSCKFDAGETNWSPQLPVFEKMELDHPNTIVKSYVKTVSSFGGMTEVRSGRGTQEYPVFVKMIDRDTDWDTRVGLQTLIPCLLHMNLIGFPFVLPDMIAGNVNEGEIVTDDLFVRWLQINTFMPALQFSFPPWELGSEVMEITQRYIQLHADYADKIVAEMEKATETGIPVNLPIWWIDPENEETYYIDDEFLLGDDLLVAPIVKPFTFSRHIYLPKGFWKDELNKINYTIEGPVWLYNYPVPLQDLPYFTKIANDDFDDYNNNQDDHQENDCDGHNDIPQSAGVVQTFSFGLIIISVFYQFIV